MYRNEASFSAALMTKLSKMCNLLQRIESGSTGRGVPDIYCRFPATELWIETKNDNRQSIYKPEYLVPWRAGQQAWHLNYWRSCHKSVLTIQAMRDGFIIIPLTQRWPHNIVPATRCYKMTELRDVLNVVMEIVFPSIDNNEKIE